MWTSTFQPAFLLCSIVATVLILERLLFLWQRWRWLKSRQLVTLELTPPATVDRTPEATGQFFTVLHGLKGRRTPKDRLLGRKTSLGLEIVSSREQGIRFLVRVEQRLSAQLQQAVHAYLPELKLAIVQEPPITPVRVAVYAETAHYAFPLSDMSLFNEQDPLAYVTGAMTKLAPDEKMALQLVITPVKLKEASLLSRKILGNEDLLGQLSSRKLPFAASVLRLINGLLFSLTDGVSEMYHGATNKSYKAYQTDKHKLQVAKRERPARTLSAFELELMESMHRKLGQPLFQVSMRATVQSPDLHEVKNRLAAVTNSFEAYGVPAYQSLRAQRPWPFVQRYRRDAYAYALPAFFAGRSMVFAASELAGLYHFPSQYGLKTENTAQSLSRQLAAPISLKRREHLDVVMGMNQYHGSETPIGLTEPERERHVYIIGGTGNGKTTMLQYAIVQDMAAGKGLAVIDPHGDLAETLLCHVPEDRINDVIYFNPDDIMHPVGVNLLELTPGLEGKELLREKDLITESVVSIFRKIFSAEDSGGHRIEYVLRNAIQTALTVPDATLFTIFHLLNDPQYRKRVVSSLDNPDLINFWKHEMAKAGEMQKVKMSAGITAKVGRFLFSASAKQILEQPRSTIDFDDIINSGKILICNLSKGLLGEDTSELFGITVLAKLQLASLRRARINREERRPFHLYVDEFQNFATASFVQMLSESRKYKLYLTMAEQSTSQQKDQQMVRVILANVGTIISFRTGNTQDERLMLPMFAPYLEAGDIANLPAYSFYAKLAAIKPQEPLSGQTLLLEQEGSETIAERVVELSRKLYAIQVQDMLTKPVKVQPEPAPVLQRQALNPEDLLTP